MTENREKRNSLLPLMNEGLGELMCRRHFVPLETNLKIWLEIGKSIEIKKRK
jgi:hypothetical protein